MPLGAMKSIMGAYGNDGSNFTCLLDAATLDDNLTIESSQKTFTHDAATINNRNAEGNHGRTTGKYYFEWLCVTAANGTPAGSEHSYGVSNASLTNVYVGSGASSWSYEGIGRKCHSGTCVGTNFNSLTDGDIIGVAVDLDNNKVWFAKNNSWQDSGDPAAGTGEAYSDLSGTIRPSCSLIGNNTDATLRTVAADQTYSPPSGFTAWDGH